MQILARKSKNNPVLLGSAGVGKTAIAEGLALRIIQEQVPENLLGCRVVALETGLLTVGTKFRGDFEERLQTIMQEIVKTPDMIIVIDELHTLMSTGVSEGSMDAANLFKPLLARGEFRCIGATTPEEYRRVIESDPALERRFQPVSVEETGTLEALDVLDEAAARVSVQRSLPSTGFSHPEARTPVGPGSRTGRTGLARQSSAAAANRQRTRHRRGR